MFVKWFYVREESVFREIRKLNGMFHILSLKYACVITRADPLNNPKYCDMTLWKNPNQTEMDHEGIGIETNVSQI